MWNGGPWDREFTGLLLGTVRGKGAVFIGGRRSAVCGPSSNTRSRNGREGHFLADTVCC